LGDKDIRLKGDRVMQSKRRIEILLVLVCATLLVWGGCSRKANGQADAETATSEKADAKARILFLHHSTGECVWGGGVEAWFEAYNKANKTAYEITEQAFPKSEPYGWENYPYDYWNIWVNNAGDKPFQAEPTLEMLTPKYDVIVWKHCFPVSQIEADTGEADVASSEKRAENYKLQYAALKTKLNAFPKTKFIVWTGAALVKSETDEAAARRAKAFFEWVRKTWDAPGDNIFIWDFHTLETEGGLYLRQAYAAGDSHPNEAFSKTVAPLFCQRVVDVLRGAGDSGDLLGKAVRSGEPPVAETSAPSKEIPQSEAAPEIKPGPEAWVFDDAEDSTREKKLWGEGASYEKDAKDDGGQVIQIRFADGREEDWGEYGVQKIVTSVCPEKNFDVASYRYVAFRAKTDKDMELVVSLVTRPDSLGRTDESYFGFTAYTHPKAGPWAWFVLDLTKLELAAEGEKAYAVAGKPTRPKRLTNLKLVTNRKNETAAVALDDITFYRTLPKALADAVQAP
jgi:hypothetical protein